MEKIIFDEKKLYLMKLFENSTHSQLKDCFDDSLGRVIFLTQPGQIGKAIGPRGSNIKKIENKLNKKIRIVEFNPTLEKFVKNIIHPLKIDEIDNVDNIITLKSSDVKTKGLLIGRNAQNLRNTEKIIQRYFKDVKEIKVI